MLESYEARYLVNLYIDCKEMNCYPYPGGPLEQTAFTVELFNFLDGVVAETRQRQADAERAEAAKQNRPKR